ncbi:ATP-binding protein [Pontibacter russatus]|uniref:ATP-binding protein n=1 Tax=Pontibacter russatus TaxID=2694929 RepID=UPI0037446D99
MGSLKPGERLEGKHSTGLGMSIAKRIIELHGGRIWIEGEENKGTSNFLGIPKRPRRSRPYGAATLDTLFPAW